MNEICVIIEDSGEHFCLFFYGVILGKIEEEVLFYVSKTSNSRKCVQTFEN